MTFWLNLKFYNNMVICLWLINYPLFYFFPRLAFSFFFIFSSSSLSFFSFFFFLFFFVFVFIFFIFFSFIFCFVLSTLCLWGRARTHDPNIKNCVLYQRSQLGAPIICYFYCVSPLSYCNSVVSGKETLQFSLYRWGQQPLVANKTHVK